MNQFGNLILVSTPIGNLGDLTPRALEALKEGELFVVEDTRVFLGLLHSLGISHEGKKAFAFHDQSQDQLESLYQKLRSEEKNVFLLSDAGSPIVSDPAHPLVVKWLEEKGEVQTLPGVSAVTTALELSGLPPIPYTFHGFFPRKKSQQEECLKYLRDGETHIFFESPHRMRDTLTGLYEFHNQFPWQIYLGRELTKKFESSYRFPLHDWPQWCEKITYKGEFVFVLYKKPLNKKVLNSVMSEELELLAEDYLKRPHPKVLAKILSKITGKPNKSIYNELNNIK